jgi:hypothetical protein
MAKGGEETIVRDLRLVPKGVALSSDAGIVTLLPLSCLNISPFNSRRYRAAGRVDELAESLRNEGHENT